MAWPNNMGTVQNTSIVSAAHDGVDDAVGMEETRWYAAVVNHNNERKAAEILRGYGYECYVATQEEYRVWRNGRRTRIDRVVIPSILFVRCTENERLDIVKYPFIFRFLTNRAGTSDRYGRPVAVIPDIQIATLRFMLENSDGPVDFIDRKYRHGDRVRVVRGNLRGLEGEVISTEDGRNVLIVRIDILGCASVSIDSVNLEPIG